MEIIPIYSFGAACELWLASYGLKLSQTGFAFSFGHFLGFSSNNCVRVALTVSCFIFARVSFNSKKFVWKIFVHSFSTKLFRGEIFLNEQFFMRGILRRNWCSFFRCNSKLADFFYSRTVVMAIKSHELMTCILFAVNALKYSWAAAPISRHKGNVLAFNIKVRTVATWVERR